MRNAKTDRSLSHTISLTRLAKYLVDSNNDLNQALGLYERNTRISEAFYTPLQCVEICFRNVIDTCMTNTYGTVWMTGGTTPMDRASLAQIRATYQDLQRNGKANPSPGDLVAEMNFSFWVSLLGPRYDATLWRRALYKGFLAGGGKKRSDAHGKFNMIRRFRNRVAHHEPIYPRDLIVLHNEILEAIGWMCNDTRVWTAHHSRVPVVVAGS